MPDAIPVLYNQHFITKQDERHNLFRLLVEHFDITSGIYPGSFVHITPSFYIPEMAFIDSDKRMSKFFRDETTSTYIERNKTYDAPAKIDWRQSDYSSVNDLSENYYDAMFSFYAGFISRICKKYLKTGGILIANNSHGDVSLALADPDYSPIGVLMRNGDKFRLKTEDIEDYVTKKDGSEIDIVRVQKRMIGERFIKQAYAYVFKKI